MIKEYFPQADSTKDVSHNAKKKTSEIKTRLAEWEMECLQGGQSRHWNRAAHMPLVVSCNPGISSAYRLHEGFNSFFCKRAATDADWVRARCTAAAHGKVFIEG